MSFQFVAELIKSPLHRASYVTRYSTRPVTHSENIAEHAYYVTMYAFLIAYEIQETRISMGHLLSKALFHDVDECVTGDFQRQFKYSDPDLPGIIHRAAMKLVPKMFDGFIGGSYVYEHWCKAKDDSIEGDIIVIADFLAVVTYIFRELNFGNQAIADILDECIRYGDSIRPRIKNLELGGIIDSAILIMAAKRREYVD